MTLSINLQKQETEGTNDISDRPNIYVSDADGNTLTDCDSIKNWWE